MTDDDGYVIWVSPKMDTPSGARYAHTQAAVLFLVDKLPEGNKWNNSYCDNLYGTENLMSELWKRQVVYTGTARENRIPKEIKMMDPMLPKNSIVVVHTKAMSMLGWIDRK